MDQGGLGTDWLGNASTGEALQVLVINDLKINQQCTLAAMNANVIWGYIGKNIINWCRELIIPLCLTLLRPHLEKFAQCWPQYKRDVRTLEQVQCMLRKLENVMYKERQREQGLVSLEKRRL